MTRILPADLHPSEKLLQDQLMHGCRIMGAKAYHPWTSKHSADGWPDTAIVAGAWLLLVELKAVGPRGPRKPTPAQVAWLDAISLVAGNVIAACATGPEGVRQALVLVGKAKAGTLTHPGPGRWLSLGP